MFSIAKSNNKFIKTFLGHPDNVAISFNFYTVSSFRCTKKSLISVFAL